MGFGAELVNPRAALVGVFPCVTGDLNTGSAAFRDDVTPADRGGGGASTLPRGWPANVSDCATLSTSAAGNCLVGNTGFSAAPEESELDCAPPVLCTMPVRGSGVAERIATDEPCVAVDDADGTDGESNPGREVDADEEPEERPEGPVLPVDADKPDDSDDEEPESDGCATATAGMVATANPTPSATASTPTRPT